MNLPLSRRGFLSVVSSAGLTWAASVTSRSLAASTSSGSWRKFEITAKVELLKHSGVSRVWLPAPSLRNVPFQKTIHEEFKAEGGDARIVEQGTQKVRVIAAVFPNGVQPILIHKFQIAAKDYSVDLSHPHKPQRLSQQEASLFLRPTRLVPTDGIVKAKATEITRDAKSDLEKAQAIYEWIVQNTSRDPKTRGCGRGDIRFMLQSNDLRGKCADLNALYVGLARAAGLPARVLYGIRAGPSGLGYKSLGPSSANITEAQHCRAEVYLKDYGWVPVDPADVRKVMLEEPPGERPLNDDLVKRTRQRLFGSWEMNWIAYNSANDVQLPGSTRAPLAFLMYPQAETNGEQVDSLDPDQFKYQITAQEITGS